MLVSEINNLLRALDDNKKNVDFHRTSSSVCVYFMQTLALLSSIAASYIHSSSNYIFSIALILNAASAARAYFCYSFELSVRR